jgi:hypothetical protein
VAVKNKTVLALYYIISIVIHQNIKKMNLLKFIVVGAAVGYGINYITKKNENGRSIVEDLADKAPDWFDQAKDFADNTINQARNLAFKK